MNKTQAIVGLAALLALGVGVAIGTGGDPNALPQVAASSLDAGQMSFRVYAADPGDGGPVVPVWVADDGGLMKLDLFPCAKRPAAVPATALGCVYRIDGGLVDFGDDNVMQPGTWFGPACVRTPCVIMWGDSQP